MTKSERELVLEVISAFHWHDKVKHGKSMARLREAVNNLERAMGNEPGRYTKTPNVV